MNNNFTHKEFKNFLSKVSNFLTILSLLPASRWSAVNFLFAPYNSLHRMPAISNFFNGNKPESMLKPVFVMQEICSYKKD